LATGYAARGEAGRLRGQGPHLTTRLPNCTDTEAPELKALEEPVMEAQSAAQAELGNLALTDELTGLYNRRGFMALAERQLKVGRRSGRGMLVFVMDVDRWRQTNDSFGHFEGDRVLKRTATLWKKRFEIQMLSLA